MPTKRDIQARVQSLVNEDVKEAEAVAQATREMQEKAQRLSNEDVNVNELLKNATRGSRPFSKHELRQGFRRLRKA